MNEATATPASAPVNMRIRTVFMTVQYNCVEASDRIVRIVDRDGSGACDIGRAACDATVNHRV